jgi:hypothetical protein
MDPSAMLSMLSSLEPEMAAFVTLCSSAPETCGQCTPYAPCLSKWALEESDPCYYPVCPLGGCSTPAEAAADPGCAECAACRGFPTVSGINMTAEVSDLLTSVASLDVLSADSSAEEKEKVLGLVRELTSALKDAAVEDGDAVVATTAVATIAVVKRSKLSGEEVKSEDTAIKLPLGITGGGAASVTQYKELPVAEPKPNDLEQKEVSTAAVDIVVDNFVATEADPVIIKLSRAKTETDAKTIEQCAYWHETKKVWSTDGCVVGGASGDELECHCTHLTLFAGLLLTLMCSNLSVFTDLAGVIADGTLDASRTWFALGVTVLMLVMLPYAYHLDKKFQVKKGLPDIFFTDELDAPEKKEGMKQKLKRTFSKDVSKDLSNTDSIVPKAEPEKTRPKWLRRMVDGIKQLDSEYGTGKLGEGTHQVTEHEKLVKKNSDWVFWSKPRIFIEVFRKSNPILSTLFPDLHICCVTKVVVFAMSTLSALALNALFFQAQGVQKDERCDSIENRQIWVGLLTALFSSVIIAVISKLHNKEVLKHRMTLAEKMKIVQRWVRRENIANFIGIMYCFFCAVYLFAFSVTIPSATFLDFTVSNVFSLGQLFFLQPAVTAALVCTLIVCGLGQSLADHFPALCDFSHKLLGNGVTQAERIKAQRALEAPAESSEEFARIPSKASAVSTALPEDERSESPEEAPPPARPAWGAE